jgi:hypothetical protein
VGLELLLVLPVLVLIVLAIVQLSLTLSAENRLTGASREGARVAALGGHPDEIVRAVRRHLGPGVFQQARVTAVLRDARGRPLRSGQPVEVGVEIPAGMAVPDLLSFVGYSIRDKTLSAHTVMRKE